MTPAVGPNQYAEITYDQNPGSASWVGVTTRTQGAGNGSGYLAIVYAGEVRLYRTDDTGSLNFTTAGGRERPHRHRAPDDCGWNPRATPTASTSTAR